MSALELVKVKGHAGFCVNRCSNHMGVRAGTHRAFLCGHPIGVLCKPCAKAWGEMWQDAQVRLRVRTDPWPTVFEVRNPEIVESAMFGPLLQGSFRPEDEPDAPFDYGAFRLDRADLIEPLPFQMELEQAA